MKHARKNKSTHKKKKGWDLKMHERIEVLQGMAIVGLLILLALSLEGSNLFASSSAEVEKKDKIQEVVEVEVLHKSADEEKRIAVDPELLERPNPNEELLFDDSNKDTYKTILYNGFNDEAAHSNWHTLSGKWFVENGQLKQEYEYGYDHSILYTGDTFETYSLRVGFEHDKDFGGGILFNAQDTEQLRRAYMVRFSKDGSGIFWGYFNEFGEFNGQGYAKRAIDEREPVLLSVNVHKDVYQVFLNNEVMSKKIPLDFTGGLIGLTTSNASVDYDRVLVNRLEEK